MHNSKIFPGTIPPTFVLGTRTFVFVLRKFTKTLLHSHSEFTNSPGTIPRTPVLGERKVGFRSPKMYQNFPTAMQNSKKNLRVEPPNPRFWDHERKVASSWNCVWLRPWMWYYQMRHYQILRCCRMLSDGQSGHLKTDDVLDPFFCKKFKLEWKNGDNSFQRLDAADDKNKILPLKDFMRWSTLIQKNRR